ncbi:MAG: glycosyltransferase [Pyrinomonadaceae bacterium]|nr:glycosyltransferase [Pyrinomonadaceae bacterium]
MKVLRIIARLNVGGPARHVVWLTGELNDREIESRLLAGTVPPGEEDMGYFAEQNGVTPRFISELSRELSLKDAVSLIKIYREMRDFQPDVVHTHTAKAGTVGRVAALIYKWATWRSLIGRPRPVRVVHTFHGHVFHSYYGGAKTRLFLFIEKVLARVATDRIITISAQQLDEISGRFGVGNARQFAVVPLGIDLGQFANAAADRGVLRAEIGAADDEIVVGFVGRLTEIKNLPLLIRAARRAIDSTAGEPKMRFVVIGDGNVRASVEELIRDQGVADAFHLLGNRPDVATLLPGLDIIALTSRNEGTPLSLIEGMASGVPFVSTAVGGVIDLAGQVADEKAGFKVCKRGVLVGDDSDASFSEGLLYLAKSEKLRQSISIAGRAFVLESYSKERLVSDIRELYRGLFSGPAAGEP